MFGKLTRTCGILLCSLLPPVVCGQEPKTSNSAEGVAPAALSESIALEGIAPAFSPDGTLVVFGRRVGTTMSLYVSERVGSQWGVPHVASFSGIYTDLEPAFDPHGKYIIFASNRPLTAGGPLAEGNYDGKVRPGKGGHQWRADRKGSDWASPVPLPDTINTSSSIFSPAIAADGSLYFMRPAVDGEKFHLFYAQMIGVKYRTPVPVSFSQLQEFGDFDPVLGNDGSFLIFSSSRPPSAPSHRSDLFIVYRKGHDWTAPVDLSTRLGQEVYGVEARLSPDNRVLYFTNSHRLPSDPPDSPEHPFVQHTWQVDLTPLLRDR